MRDSDWSRPKILRSDWLLLFGASMTTTILKDVAKLSLYLSFNVYLYYLKIKIFMPRLSRKNIFFQFLSVDFLS